MTSIKDKAAQLQSKNRSQSPGRGHLNPIEKFDKSARSTAQKVTSLNSASQKPSEAEAREAVRTLIRFAGDDPSREGLIDTPKRVVKAYKEFYKGYDEDPLEILSRTFEDVSGYDEMVMLRGIEMHSHCEHHMVPFTGKVHIAYYPDEKVVGLSKLARIVETFARRLQTQETMTAQLATAIDEGLNAKGTAIMIEAEHQCMSSRGVHKPGVATITTRFTGLFKQDKELRDRFLDLANKE